MKMASHQLSLTFPKNEVGDITECIVSVEKTARIIFQALEVAAGKKVDAHNAGSLLMTGEGATKWDWDAAIHEKGFLRVLPHLRHEVKRQFSGVVPAKPGVYPTRDVKVVERTVRRWA